MQFTLTPSAPVDGYGEALLPVAAAKAWCRIDDDEGEEDDLIAALRDAAIDMVEQYGNLRLLLTTGLIATFGSFGSRMRPGIGPASTMVVTGISYTDSNGSTVTLGGGTWRIDTMGTIVPSAGTSWPSGALGVQVTFTAGYPAGACPAGLIQAAKLFVAHLYANREAVVTGTITAEIPLGFRALVDRYRMPVL